MLSSRHLPGIFNGVDNMKKTISPKIARRLSRERKENIEEMRLNTVCPYFKDATPYAMQCQSIVKNAELNLRFKQKEHLQSFNKKFCQNLDMCGKCPYHKLNSLYFNSLPSIRTYARAKREIEDMLRKYK